MNKHAVAEEMIQLSSADIQATVDRKGAYLTSFGTNQGVPFIYPKQEIPTGEGKTKVRGGSHVCFPNFGPDVTHGFAQHGIGRLLTWDVVDKQSDSVTLVLVVSEAVIRELSSSQPAIAEYAGVRAELRYKISGAPTPALEMELIVANSTSRTLRFAPGFHPYFQLSGGLKAESVHVDDGATDAAVGACNPSYEKSLNPTDGVRAKVGNDSAITITGLNMNRITYWSDDPEKFICIEPTSFGASFSEGNPPANLEVLPAGEKLSYSMKVVWSV